MHSPDVDVFVAFVNPVTIVPIEEHIIFYVVLSHNPCLERTCHSLLSIFEHRMTN